MEMSVVWDIYRSTQFVEGEITAKATKKLRMRKNHSHIGKKSRDGDDRRSCTTHIAQRKSDVEGEITAKATKKLRMRKNHSHVGKKS